MKSNFDTLLVQYPSGMRVNSLLAAKYFGLLQNQILIGNGAAELINSLMRIIGGVTGFIRPTFEEYPNRFDRDNSVIMKAKAPDYTYSADDIIDFFSGNKVDIIVLINPDNPSGNFIEQKDVLRLADWCRSNDIKLIYDESFSDFSGDGDNSVLNREILSKYGKNLIVIKSLSKSHGIPGIRLGILACGDDELIAGLKKFSVERDRFYSLLNNLPFLNVIPSKANYFMCRVTCGTARELAVYLLKMNIFIKDLTSKINDGNEYIRLSIRNSEDNDKIIEALKDYQGNCFN